MEMETPTDLDPKERQAIEQLFQEMYQAWTDNDAQRYAACFEADVDYVAFDGTHLKGRAENERLHRMLFETVLRDTRLEGGLLQLRQLTAEVVLAHSTGAVAFPWQKRLAKNRLSIQTLVLVKRDGGWLAAAFQNTRVKPMPAPERDSLAVRAFSAYAALRRALAPNNPCWLGWRAYTRATPRRFCTSTARAHPHKPSLAERFPS